MFTAKHGNSQYNDSLYFLAIRWHFIGIEDDALFKATLNFRPGNQLMSTAFFRLLIIWK